MEKFWPEEALHPSGRRWTHQEIMSSDPDSPPKTFRKSRMKFPGDHCAAYLWLYGTGSASEKTLNILESKRYSMTVKTVEMVVTKEGVIAEKDGKYFGTLYEDGHGTTYGFGDIVNARISNPEYCKEPTDMVNKDSHYRGMLETASLKNVRIETRYYVV